MKYKITFLLFGLLSCLTGSYATTFTVTTAGFTFSPDSFTITAGDTVVFSISSMHNVVEVSHETWTANGSSPLAGGFSLPFGGGSLVITGIGTHYFVCRPHASLGMKGAITVAGTPLSTAQVLPATGALVIQSSYPNPHFTANAASNTIAFSSNNSGPARLSLFNALGREVARVYEGYMEQGRTYTLTADVTKLPAGEYVYRLSQGSDTVIRRLAILP
jgi:plastocyanin